MSVKVGINGFGRIGRNVFRAAVGRQDIDIVAVNDLPIPTQDLAYLLKYDSILGELKAKVEPKEGSIVVDNKPLLIVSHKDPAEIPWKNLGVEIVIESTGVFTDAQKARGHITAGARKVIITAPAKNEDITIVIGVNEKMYDPGKHHVISNASCTTNCLAPLAKVIMDNFGIRRGLMTTIHSYTNDQRVLDLVHKDRRRARAAGLSMIPTSTGAAKAIGLVIPELKGKMDGLAIRVPTPNVSLVDLVCEMEKDTDEKAVNGVLKSAAEGYLKGIMVYSTEPLVSRDFNGNPASCIIDSEYTKVIDKRLLKTMAWYDNEWGYSSRIIDLITYINR